MIRTPFNDPAEQRKQLDRVQHSIANTVLEFAREHPEFCGKELHRYVASRHGNTLAPGSADRIMRELRKRNALDYECVDRAASRYRVLRVA